MTATIEITEDVAWITIDDGKVNALSAELLGEIDHRLEQAGQQARVTVLSGRPGIFSAGFDLKAFGRGPTESLRMVRAGVCVIDRMLTHPHPILALCTGHAYPMGAFLLLSADLRLGASGDWRIGLNEVAIQITVPRFALALARHRLTAPGFARITTAAMFDPESAIAMGYLDEVVPPAALAERAHELIQGLLALDLPSYRATKARVNEAVLEAVRATGSEQALAAGS
jgi:enoyl-CoA hydratase